MELYLIFPLTNEESTISLGPRHHGHRRLVLLLLLAGIAWLVCGRWCCRSRTASAPPNDSPRPPDPNGCRCAARDDMARLAVSFNDGRALSRQITSSREFGNLHRRRFTSDVSHERAHPWLTTVRMAPT